MMIIAVDHIPNGWNIRKAAAYIAKAVKRHLTPLGFSQHGEDRKYKQAFFQLAKDLDPNYVIEGINQLTFDGKTYLDAFIPKPDKIPRNIRELPLPLHLPPSKSLKKSLDKVKKHAKRQRLTVHDNVYTAIVELIMELKRKYMGIDKRGPELEKALAEAIYDRVQLVLTEHNENDCHAILRAYRSRHPHFADFQFVLAKLHEVEDRAGLPKSQLLEADLIESGSREDLLNAPQVMDISSKYSDKLLKKVLEHISCLDSSASEGESAEAAARKAVRAHLKKMTPYLPMIMKHMINKQFVTRKNDSKFIIYGEPDLPKMASLATFLRGFRVKETSLWRSRYAFNAVRLNAPPAQAHELLKADGAILDDMKLIIRKMSDGENYKMDSELKSKVKEAYGDTPEN